MKMERQHHKEPPGCHGCKASRIIKDMSGSTIGWKCRSILAIKTYQEDLAKICPCKDCIVKVVCINECNSLKLAKMQVMQEDDLEKLVEMLEMEENEKS
jgi:hypothetical protein